jgi:hypothetical protein
VPYGFKYLLVTPDEEPTDPAAFVTAVPNWSEGEVITLGSGKQLRVVATQPTSPRRLIERGFNGMLIVEPLSR